MSPRRFILLSGRLVQACIYAAVAGVVLFFALTRTEVGREGLRVELERQFSHSFHGKLQIGHLTGNLLNRLSASSVELRDSTGKMVLSVDSIIVYPRLQDLLRKTFSTGRITLVGPELHLARLEDGTWKAKTLFNQRPIDPARQSWSFRATEVQIIGGRISTSSAGPPPRSVSDSLIFNYADAEVVEVNGRAIIDWQPDVKLLDILQLSGRIPDLDLNLENLRGQVYIENDEVALNAVHLRLGDTWLDLAGSLSSFRELRDDPAAAVVELELRESTLNGDELRRIFPKLAFADQLTAAARIQGPLAGLVVEELALQRGSSSLAVEGTLLGLPDSLDYELVFRPASVSWRDLRALWPGLAAPGYDHLGSVEFSGYSDGIIRFKGGDALPLWQAHSQLQVSSRAGRIEGDANLAIDGRRSLLIDGSFHTADLDLAAITGNESHSSRLNGLIAVAASGPDLRHAEGGASIVLGRSSIAGRQIDSLQLHASGIDGRVNGRLSFSQGVGRLLARVEADFDSTKARYRIDGATAQLDLGRLLLSDSLSSSLNTRFVLAGEGNSWKSFEGDVTLGFDSSRVTYAGRNYPVQSHESRLVVRDLAGHAPVIRLSGDVLDVEITGDAEVRPFMALARHWGGEIGHVIELHRTKRYRKADSLHVAAVAKKAAPDIGDLPSQRVKARVNILRSDILSALFPMLPELRTDAKGQIGVTMDSKSLDLDAQFSADSLIVGGAEARDLTISLRTIGSPADGPSSAVAVDLTMAASRLLTGEQEFLSPEVTAVVGSDKADVDFQAFAPGALQAQRLSARVDLLPDRNRLTLQDLQFVIRNQEWESSTESVVDLYGDAIVVHGIDIVRQSDADSTRQRLLVEGTLSRSPVDTLFLELKDISIQQLAEMAGVQKPLGGALNGRIAYTGLDRTPEITGDVELSPLSYDDRVLGRLSLTSRYIPGSPDIGLMARLRPLSENELSSLQPLEAVEDSRLAVEGTFRLPHLTAETHDRGSLDLRVDVEHADAFFFEYIFKEVISDVGGHLTGSGTIKGDFSKPLFDASVELVDGRFLIPEFRLRYKASGPVGVDASGIHLNGLTLTDATDGRADIRGSILFNDYRFFSFNLAGNLSELRVLNVSQSRDLPFYGRIWASGNVTLTGPLSATTLRSRNMVTSSRSDLFIPISETAETGDAGFIVFADSTGKLPDIKQLTLRDNLLAIRPAGEREFLDGMEVDLNISAPEGSTVHLVIDPLLGDVINAVGSGRVQLVRSEGEFSTYGTFNVSSGDYLFTAGEVFFRRFLIDEGKITWDGDPLNAQLNMAASYRTRASTAGLPVSGNLADRLISLIIKLNVSGRVATPIVDLSLDLERDERGGLVGDEGIVADLNQPDRSAQYATSVLLTNSFLLTTDGTAPLSGTRNQLAFNSLSQLVASQLNRYLNYALPNLDLNFGVQGESAQNLDVTYGVALRLLDERLIIRGQGIYESEQPEGSQQGVLDEFVVEVRLSPGVSVEVFYRREDDLLTPHSSSNHTGAGLSYQTQFTSWSRLMDRLFGWIGPTEKEDDPEDGIVAGARE